MDIPKARAARAASATEFPIRLRFPLDVNSDWHVLGPRYVVLLLHESGEISWDAEGFKDREGAALDGFFGVMSRPEAEGTLHA